MPLLVNLRHLEINSVRLEGEMPVAELDIDPRDEVIQVGPPLEYDLEAQQMEEGILVQGRLCLPLRCQCVKCLKTFYYRLELPKWALHLPLQGEEAVPIANDCADLTPFVREDILLEFPRHPVCNPECRGLPGTSIGKARKAGNTNPSAADLSAWAELNKLKF